MGGSGREREKEKNKTPKLLMGALRPWAKRETEGKSKRGEETDGFEKKKKEEEERIGEWRGKSFWGGGGGDWPSYTAQYDTHFSSLHTYSRDQGTGIF